MSTEIKDRENKRAVNKTKSWVLESTDKIDNFLGPSGKHEIRSI